MLLERAAATMAAGVVAMAPQVEDAPQGVGGRGGHGKEHNDELEVHGFCVTGYST